MEGLKVTKNENEERTFFLSFLGFFFFFCFTLFKPLKFVLGLPKWEFSTGKKHLKAFHTGKKNQEK